MGHGDPVPSYRALFYEEHEHFLGAAVEANILISLTISVWYGMGGRDWFRH